jgi:glutamyl-tRNA synthetase
LARGYPADDERLNKIAPLIHERLVTLEEAPDLAGFFFEEEVRPIPEELVAKGLTAAQSADVARRCLDVLEKLSSFTHEAIEPPMRVLVEELGLSTGQVFGILRVAVTGKRVSPPLFEGFDIIGREKVLDRIRDAIKNLEDIH